MSGSFFDSNILIYTASSDSKKAEQAHMLLQDGGNVSVQVLNEVTNVCRKKMHFDWPTTFAFLATLRALVTVRDVKLADHDRGLRIASRYGFRIYDAVIVATAIGLGSTRLYSEDLQHGQVIDGGLTIINPFRS
jgi:predicted nucleic acid-binding protein